MAGMLSLGCAVLQVISIIRMIKIQTSPMGNSLLWRADLVKMQ